MQVQRIQNNTNRNVPSFGLCVKPEAIKQMYEWRRLFGTYAVSNVLKMANGQYKSDIGSDILSLSKMQVLDLVEEDDVVARLINLTFEVPKNVAKYFGAKGFAEKHAEALRVVKLGEVVEYSNFDDIVRRTSLLAERNFIGTTIRTLAKAGQIDTEEQFRFLGKLQNDARVCESTMDFATKEMINNISLNCAAKYKYGLWEKIRNFLLIE